MTRRSRARLDLGLISGQPVISGCVPFQAQIGSDGGNVFLNLASAGLRGLPKTLRPLPSFRWLRPKFSQRLGVCRRAALGIFIHGFLCRLHRVALPGCGDCLNSFTVAAAPQFYKWKKRLCFHPCQRGLS